MSRISLAAAVAVALSTSLMAQSVVGSFPIVTGNGTPVGLDASPGGKLFYTDIGANDESGVVDLTGTISSSVVISANSGNPIGVTRDGAGLMYITDTTTDEVDIYDAALNYMSSFSVAAQTTFPEGIAYSAVTNSLFVVDGTGGNQALEYDLAGNFIAGFPLLGSSIDGIAWSAAGNTFWIYDSGTDTVRQYDSTFVEIRNFPGTRAAGFASGEGVAVIGNTVFVCATGSDTVVLFDVRDSASLQGTAEATLNSTSLSANAVHEFEDGWTLRMDAIDQTVGSTLTAKPFFTFLNFGPGGAPANGVTGLIPGFGQLWAGSNPVGFSLNIPPVAVGIQAGWTVQIPNGAFSPGDTMRMQGLMFDSSLPGTIFDQLVPSNVISFRHRAPLNILIKADGSNSFNSTTTSGFFSVANVASSPIASVTFDWVTSSNAAQATMTFDTDQGAMADVFEGGNSAVAGCLGTYRNGSAASTGLIFDNLNTVNATPCDPLANGGWIGTNMSTTDSYRTVEFRFTNFTSGKTFEVDIDTDGGAGISGDNMVGMVVTIKLVNGTVLTGELANPVGSSSSLNL